MLRAFICQWHNSLTEAELLLSYWHDPSVIGETKALLKELFNRIEPLLFTPEPKWVGGSGQPSQVLTLTLVQ